MKILFFADTEPNGASLDLRCKAIGQELQKHGYQVDICAGWTKHALFGSIPVPNLKAYLAVLAKMPGKDVLVMHRQGNPVAYSILLWAKLLRKRVVYDMDDAMFAHNASRHPKLHALWWGLLPRIIRSCDAVVVGSHLLAQYTLALNSKTNLIPSPVDTSLFRAPAPPSRKVCIGWMGQGTFHVENLRLLVGPLAMLSKEYSIRLKLVSSLGSTEIREMFGAVPNLEVDYGLDYMVDLADIPAMMADFDISVAPLEDNVFSNGRCAIKTLDSMAMGIPVVASDVGENSHVITNGYDGFLARGSSEWVERLRALITSPTLRKMMGDAGRQTVSEKGYTLEACGAKWKEVLSEYI